jgi:hypothetical protein
MTPVRTFVRQLRRSIRRVRSLIRDDDHDTWLDQHGKRHDKPTNLAGPWSQSGG